MIWKNSARAFGRFPRRDSSEPRGWSREIGRSGTLLDPGLPLSDPVESSSRRPDQHLLGAAGIHDLRTCGDMRRRSSPSRRNVRSLRRIALGDPRRILAKQSAVAKNTLGNADAIR